ncbi:MAG: hypothetical protein HY342_09295 [Candidatus Lambdaproteobacteria bacterium]|nr:hypothetical protein [Candidatus Lambdaproteobacteria bacterium]
MKSVRMLWRIGLPLLLALLVAACAATTEDKKTEDTGGDGDTPPTITGGREYTFEEGDEQGGSFTATLTLGETQFLYALVSDPSIAVWGTAATLNNGFLKLRITHATHPEETINRDVFASEMKNGVLAIFDADNFYVESESAYRESSPGVNRGGSCATGGEVYNAVGVPQSGFDQLTDTIYGTAALASGPLTLTLSGYALDEDLATGVPETMDFPTPFACIGGNTLTATGATIAFAQAGFGVLQATDDQGGDFTAILVPPPTLQIPIADFTQEGRVYTGFAEQIWDDPSDVPDQGFITLQRPIRAIGQGNDTLRAIPLIDIEDNEPISPDSAQIVVARSGSAPNGFFDLSTINMGAGPQPFPFTVALTPTGEYVLVGVVGTPLELGGTSTDWEFVVLSEQQIGTGYPVAAPSFFGDAYTLLSAQGDQGGAPNLTIGTNESAGSFRVTDPNTGTNSWGTIANHSSGFVQLTLTHSTEPGLRLGQALYGGVIPGSLFFALPEDEYEPVESAFTESIAGPAVGPGCTVAYDNGTIFNVSAFPESGFDQLADTAWGTATVQTPSTFPGATATTFDLTVSMFRIDQDATAVVIPQTIVGLDCMGTPNGVGDRFLVGPAGSATVLRTDGGFLAFPAPTTAIDAATEIQATGEFFRGFVQSARSDGMGDFPERYMLVTAQGAGTSLIGAAYNIFTNTSATGEAVTITLGQSVLASNGRFDSGTLTDTQGVRPLRLLAWRNPLDGDKIALVGFVGNNAVGATPDDWDFIVVYEQ